MGASIVALCQSGTVPSKSLRPPSLAATVCGRGHSCYVMIDEICQGGLDVACFGKGHGVFCLRGDPAGATVEVFVG